MRAERLPETIRAPILGALLLRFARDLFLTRRGYVPARHTFGIATLGLIALLGFAIV
jgi:hypothetical protein